MLKIKSWIFLCQKGEFMTLKQEYIEKIDKIAKVSFNNEQKEIAKKILQNTSESDLSAVYGLITQRVKTGFVFDEAPETNHDCVALIKENEKLGINLDLPNCLEHKFIIGDNYDVLKNLCATYIDKNGKGMIDVIYIDPPYNTEKAKEDGNDYKEEVEASKFIYRDKFTRDGWLNMMNERLKLARKLLSDTGVIFISIDDREQAYLKVLCDEIFGEENFVGNLPRLTKKSGKSSDNIQKNHDYLMIYFKTQNMKLEQFEHLDAGFKHSDNFEKIRGKYKLNQTLDYSSIQYSPSLDYEIVLNGESFIPGSVTNSEMLERQKRNPKNDFCWRWSKDLFDFGLKNDFIVVNEKTHRIYTKTYQNASIEISDDNEYFIDITPRKKTMSSLDLLDNIFSNDSAKKELIKIFGTCPFDYPKPSKLIYNILKRIRGNKYTILDFFAGSGTTAQAVMELNAEDGGQRQFILATNNENNIAMDVTRERMYRVINGKGSKGEKFEWQYTKEKPYLSNNSVRVFEIEHTPLTLSDLDKAEKLKNRAKIEFKKLNPNYSTTNDFDIYNELSALNPYKEQE